MGILLSIVCLIYLIYSGLKGLISNMLPIHLIIMQMCKPVPKMVPTVSCETRMKEIELKEICIDIDIQLPRFSLLVFVICVVLVRLLLLLLLIFVGLNIK